MIEGTQEYNEKLIKRLHKVKYALAAPPVRLASFGAENFKNCYTKFEHKNYSLKNERIFLWQIVMSWKEIYLEFRDCYSSFVCFSKNISGEFYLCDPTLTS